MALSNFQFTFGQWWFNHKDRFLVWAARVAWVLVVAGGVWIGSIWLQYARQAFSLDPRNPISSVSGMVPAKTVTDRSAIDVVLGSAQVLANSDGTITVFAPIENKNKDYLAEVSYVFTVGGKERDTMTSFVLPEQRLYLLLPAFKPSGQTSATVSISSVSWSRIKEKAYWPFALNVDSVAVTPVSLVVNADGTASTPVSWISDITYHHQAYGTLSNAMVQVVVQRGGSVIGVQNAVLSQAAPYEPIRLRLQWPIDVTGDVTFTVAPAFNVFDRSFYLSL